MNRLIRRMIVAGLGTLLLTAAGCGRPGGLLLTPVSTDKRLAETTLARDEGLFVTDKIVVVDVDGMIANGQTGPMFGPQENPTALFVEKLDKAADDPDVRALIVRINSPGGTVAASDIMHRRLAEFRKKRPDVVVVAAILDVGASGGYYLACAAQKIYALPSSVTGSIGVIFQTFSIAGSLALIGVKTEAIKSGANKDLASPLHDLTERERAILQKIIDQYYEQFLGAVLAGRPGLTREKLLPLADGRVFTGPQALDAGLVDELLYPDQIVARVKKQASVRKARLVMYHRPLGYKANLYSRGSVPSPSADAGTTVNVVNVDLANALNQLAARPQFCYLWTGR